MSVLDEPEFKSFETSLDEMAKVLKGLDDAASQAMLGLKEEYKTLQEYETQLERNNWGNEHQCGCGWPNAAPPCGHCEGCMSCNCAFCEDAHPGEWCPRCERCYMNHEYREDGLCPMDIMVTSWSSQADFEKLFEDTEGPIGDRLAAVARKAAWDAVWSVRILADEDESPEQAIINDFELSEEEDLEDRTND